MSTTTPLPRPILKRSQSVFPHNAPPSPAYASIATPRRPSNNVRFPPSPTLTRTFSAHSPASYDRSPIVVLPNSCALPARGCPGRTYHAGSDLSPSNPNRLSSYKSGKHVHPCVVDAAGTTRPPPLVHDFSSESDESDGIASPPLNDVPPIAVADLSLAFLPFAGSAPYRAPEQEQHQYHTYEEEKRRRREREQKDHRGDDRSRHRRAVGVRDVERQTGDLSLDDEVEEDDPEEDDLAPAAGCYKSFGERSALSGCGFDVPDDEGCLGGF